MLIQTAQGSLSLVGGYCLATSNPNAEGNRRFFTPPWQRPLPSADRLTADRHTTHDHQDWTTPGTNRRS
jgi:hypothetical protein